MRNKYAFSICRLCRTFRVPDEQSTYCELCTAWVIRDDLRISAPVVENGRAIITHDIAPAVLALDRRSAQPASIPAWRTALLAASVYLARHSARVSPPGMYLSLAGVPLKSVWYPDSLEMRSCCKLLGIRNKDTLWNHCRTMKHAANLFYVSIDEVNRHVEIMKSLIWEAGTYPYLLAQEAPLLRRILMIAR